MAENSLVDSDYLPNYIGWTFSCALEQIIQSDLCSDISRGRAARINTNLSKCLYGHERRFKHDIHFIIDDLKVTRNTDAHHRALVDAWERFKNHKQSKAAQ